MQFSAPRSATHLTGRLQERLGFDVADRAADFGDDHVDIIARLGAHAGLDSVGDVRDDLHALAEVLPARSLRVAPLLINLPGGDVGLLGEEHVQEALVVADVEIGLGTASVT